MDSHEILRRKLFAIFPIKLKWARRYVTPVKENGYFGHGFKLMEFQSEIVCGTLIGAHKGHSALEHHAVLKAGM